MAEGLLTPTTPVGAPWTLPEVLLEVPSGITPG
ncbi:hypothetical protein SAMN06272781_5890 [Streptomyces sp. 1222.2]|uniref:Uncharacterized protein n=1 Tax=Streptomyces stelliscabiei TaxID=146820 RepID=A0A8I0P1J1_9ACTN|nr:hypothetical protein [Streptomyces stelliscabiei]SOD78046.1 hypothetical protein SAMN06272781_5890 [Streptomyces sp. 1222.2]